MKVRMIEVEDAIHECVRRAQTTGRNWHAVTVCPGPEGEASLVIREETAPCFSVEEVYKKDTPHPATVWSQRGTCKDWPKDPTEDTEDYEAFTMDASDIRGIAQQLREAGFQIED